MATNRDQLDNQTRSILHNSRGIDLAERGWLDEAIIEFKNAVETAPDFAQGYDNLATAYADKGDLLSALTCYAKALSLEPDNPIALHNLGCFLSNYGNSLATRCFKNALKLDPELYEARFNIGLCLAAEDNHEKAVVQFERALAYNENDHDVRLQMALSLIALKKYPSAIKELLQITKAEPTHEQAWFHLGQSYQEQGFLEEAIRALSKAIGLNNNNLECFLSLASVLARLGRMKEARSAIKRAKSLDPKRTDEFLAHDELLCNDTKPYK